MLTNGEDVKHRWNKYFKTSLNKDYPREAVENISWNEVFIGLVSEKKVKSVLRAMKKKKVVEPDGVPVKV